MTSLTGKYVRIYPMPVWLALEEKLGDDAVDAPGPAEVSSTASTTSARWRRSTRRAAWSSTPRLRESAGMAGDVDVFGQYDYLDVWNHERFLAKLQREPYTDDDARALSEFGI